MRDFLAAVEEIQSNLDVRRLMFVVINLLVPGMIVATVDCLAGTSYPDHLLWLPHHSLLLLGCVLLVAGVLVSAVLVRCHFGMVVNGNKIAKVRSGTLALRPLNWLGVTTNFVLVTALSAGAGLALVLLALGQPFAAVAGCFGLVVLVTLALRINHFRANRLSRTLDPHWEKREIGYEDRERHLQESLSSTTNDISVIVSMQGALFVGLFTAMANLGGISAETAPSIGRAELQNWGPPALMGYLVVSLTLCQRMVVRLRIALAEHSGDLAELRGEPDQPWRFRLLERTFLLYLLGALFLVASLALLLMALQAGIVTAIASGAAAVVLLAYYPLVLAIARAHRG